MSTDALDPEPLGAWLDDGEQRVWRRWLDVTSRLPRAIDRGLREDGQLSLRDFDVLVRLSDQAHDPEPRLRTADLAEMLSWEPDWVLEQVSQLQARALVRLEEPTDPGEQAAGRGAWVTMTDAGRAAIQAAAPAHVGLVRFLLFDTLTGDDLQVLERITATMAQRLDDLGVRPGG